MRANIMMLVLVVVVGLVAAMVILKGARQPVGVTPPPTEEVATPEVAQSSPPESSTTATEQAPVADAQTLVEKITDIQAEGSPTPEGRALLLAALSEGKEKEVRQAALNAIVQLDDTDAIPGLEQALPGLIDPRDKTAVMDAIEQLKLPATMPDVAPSGDLRSYRPPGVTIKHNPRFLRGQGRPSDPSQRVAPDAPPPTPAPQ